MFILYEVSIVFQGSMYFQHTLEDKYKVEKARKYVYKRGSLTHGHDE